jgi:hypothetical protein
VSDLAAKMSAELVHHRRLERLWLGRYELTDYGFDLFLRSFERGYEDLHHVREVGLKGGALIVARIDYRRVSRPVVIDLRTTAKA